MKTTIAPGKTEVKENTIEKANSNNKQKTPGLNKGKGTGLSSEAGSNQTEKSWLGTNGSNADATSIKK